MTGPDTTGASGTSKGDVKDVVRAALYAGARTATEEAAVNANKGHEKDKEKQFEIKIDRENFKIGGPTITGAELRQLTNPPIGADRDLFLTVPGPDPDRSIGETEAVELKNGMHFFTAPSNITPGGPSRNR